MQKSFKGVECMPFKEIFSVFLVATIAPPIVITGKVAQLTFHCGNGFHGLVEPYPFPQGRDSPPRRGTVTRVIASAVYIYFSYRGLRIDLSSDCYALLDLFC